MSVRMAPISFVYEGIGSQILSVGSCKHNEPWGITSAGTSKTVLHLLYGICVSIWWG